MAEGGREVAGQTIAPYIGAVYKNGWNAPLAHDRWTGKDLVPFYDVKLEEERLGWCLENMRVFSDGKTFSQANAWRQVEDDWLRDLNVAARKSNMLEGDEREIKTRSEIIAMMAVSSSARAMEFSNGAAEAYGSFLTESQGETNLDQQDNWKEYLLHNDPEKMATLLNIPIIREIYIQLLKDGGYEVPSQWENMDLELVYQSDSDKDGQNLRKEKKAIGVKVAKVSIEDVVLDPDDLDQIKEARDRKGGLFEILSDKKGAGLNAWILQYLTPKDKKGNRQTDFILGLMDKYTLNETAVWAAAKLACDAFLVDKFTLWEFAVSGYLKECGEDNPNYHKFYKFAEKMLGKDEMLDEKGKIKTKKLFPEFKPSKDWGGNPLGYLLEPSYLPKRIKRAYPENPELFDLIDATFAPEMSWDNAKKLDEDLQDALTKGMRKKLPVSMVGHLKNFIRYGRAHYMFLGDSLASGVPKWDDKSLENLKNISLRLYEVFGGVDAKLDEKDHALVEMDRAGKQVCGLIFSRILLAKAYALALESQKPNFMDNVKLIFGNPEQNPFDKAAKYVWGQNLNSRDGLLYSAARQVGFVFGSNQLGAQDALDDAWKIIETRHQEQKGGNMAGFIRGARTGLRLADIISRNWLGKR